MPRSGMLVDIDKALADRRLQRAGSSATGVWFRCLLFMFAGGRRGSWTGSEREMLDTLSVDRSEWNDFVHQIQEYGFGQFVQKGKVVTMTAPLEIIMEAPPGSLPAQDGLSLGLEPGEDPEAVKRLKPPYKAIMELWNKLCANPSVGLPKCLKISGTRSDHVRARWRENPDIVWWRELFTKISLSSFLTGKKKTARGYFRASFDFATDPSKTIRILEGAYDDRPGQNGNGGGTRSIEDQPGGKNYTYD